jgi:hypothetical protein
MKGEGMTEGGVRAIVGAVALAAGVALGWVIHQAAPVPPTPGRGTQVIRVGPKPGQVNPPKVHVSKQATDVLFWITTDPKDQLLIETDEEIFEGQTHQGNGSWLVSCHGRICESGEILPGASEQSHKTWQTLITNGTPARADAYVIIER